MPDSWDSIQIRPGKVAVSTRYFIALDTSTIKDYWEFAIRVAKEAGEITLSYFQSDLRVDRKSDGTPVTAADLATERLVRSRIQQEYPDHGVLGEEYGVSSNGREKPHWIIDPIDGTKAFIHGIPLYAVLLSLVVDERVQVGVAHFPALSETLAAGRGYGCWWSDHQACLSKVERLQDALVVHTNFATDHLGSKAGAWHRLENACGYFAGWGDAYGYLLVATGRAEVMVDPKIHIWDVAPFPVIFEELGGYFGDWQGNQTMYAGEALATSNQLLSEVLECLNP